MTKERPILLSGPMVRAILDDRKTQTRRLAKPPAKAVFLPEDYWRIDPDEPGTAYLDDGSGRLRITCPYGAPGDRLWVRETFAARLTERGESNPNPRYVKYRADGGHDRSPSDPMDWHQWPDRWTSSIRMPRWASRLTLEITGVRVERLNEISEDDAKAEGAIGYALSLNGRAYDRFEANWCRYSKQIDADAGATARGAFAALWETIHGPGSWAVNPWVWVIEFARTEGRNR